MNIETQINELRKSLIETLPENTVSVNIFITYNDVNFSIVTKRSESLKKDCISMRNLKGDWIK